MPKTRAQKEEAVVEIAEKISRAKSVVFADYKGMTMTQLGELRKTLRTQGAEFSVTKNTLLEKALKAEREPMLQGPTATLYSFEDEIAPLKTLVKAFKDNNVGSVKGGFLGEEKLDAAKITQLSTLPTKDELRAKTVGVLVAPLQGMIGVLQGNLRNLVYALHQIQLQKGGE